MKATLAAAAIVAAVLTAGEMDYQDARAEQAHYCDMVQAGHWPDYNRTARDHCPQTAAHETRYQF